jgi:hypothetical protein
MGAPICPGCKNKLTTKRDVNVEGISGGLAERFMGMYIVYCEKCGYPIGGFQKPEEPKKEKDK